MKEQIVENRQKKPFNIREKIDKLEAEGYAYQVVEQSKPTIAELEEILEKDGTGAIEIMPNGEIKARETKCPICGYKWAEHKYTFNKEPAKSPSATSGFNSAVIRPEMKVNKVKDVGQPFEPLEFPKMDDNTDLIVNACRQVVQSAEDYESETMTTPKTVVQSICELDTLFDNIRSYNKEEKADKKAFED